MNPSRAVVTALADALHLSGVDRTYLFTLTAHTPPTAIDAVGPDAALLQSFVDHVQAPAYCTDAFTNVLAGNSLGQARSAWASSLKSDTRTAISSSVCANDTSHCSSSPGGVRMLRFTPHSQDSSATRKSVAL